MDFLYSLRLLRIFITDLPQVLAVTVFAYALGIFLAIPMSLLKINRIPILSRILDVYTEFIRCIPGLLRLFLIYYGLPVLAKQLFGIQLDSLNQLFFCIASLVAFGSAQMSETFRAAFGSIGEQQEELADSLCYSFFQKLQHVMLPLAIRIALPDLGNSLIDMFKDTSLFYTIGVIDLMGRANSYVVNNYGIHQTEIYFSVALVYWFGSLILIQIVNAIEYIFLGTQAKEGRINKIKKFSIAPGAG